MTLRRGHDRTNRFGKTFPVREHVLIAGEKSQEFRLTWRQGQAYLNGSVTYKTTCPQCRSEVFFYRNEHGSRVFFDKLGAPWPKHGCTHGVRAMQHARITSAQPVRRGQKKTSSAEEAQGKAVCVDLDSLKSGVRTYNRDVLRAAKLARKAKKN